MNYDDAARQIGWDDLDLRYSRVGSLFGAETVYGVSFNNDPTVTDLWNSTSVWGYPYMASTLAPTPTTTLVEGTLGSQVIGLNPYIYWNRLIFADVGFYRTFSPRMDTTLGADPAFSSIKGVTFYWRLAVEPKWGRNAWEFGTFGLAANLNPGRVTGFGTDHTTDVGFDSQYQFLGTQDSITVKGSWITENQNLTASQALGNTTNGHDHLRSLHADITYFFENTYGGTIQYFTIDGSGDPNAYGGTYSSPNSKGVSFELNYIPFSDGGPAFWPWMNVKFGAQYTLYTQFSGGTRNYDGNGRSAANNNTLYLYSELAF